MGKCTAYTVEAKKRKLFKPKVDIYDNDRMSDVNRVPPSNLKWQIFDSKELDEFKKCYHTTKANHILPIDELLSRLNKKYFVMSIRDSINDKLAGFALYKKLDSDNNIELVYYYGPICSSDETFTPPGVLKNFVKKEVALIEEDSICKVCEAWTC